MKSFVKFLALTFITLVLVVNIAPIKAAAQTPKCIPGPNGYCPLTALPGTSDATGNVNINTYIPAVVKLIIGIAGALAVIRIIFGGIKYMTSDAFEQKSDAKETITNAIIGLLLAMSAYIILFTINPNLVNLKLSIEGLRVGSAIDTNLGSTTPTTGGSIAGVNITSSCIDKNGNTTSCTCISCSDAKNLGNPPLTFKNYSTMNVSLLQDLMTVRANTNMGWQVTEAWPTTSPHSDLCHTNGSCVDLNLTTDQYVSGTPTKAQVIEINGLASAIKSLGRSAIFEVNTANYNALSAAGVDSGLLRDVSKSAAYVHNTAPSFHVN